MLSSDLSLLNGPYTIAASGSLNNNLISTTKSCSIKYLTVDLELSVLFTEYPHFFTLSEAKSQYFIRAKQMLLAPEAAEA